MVTPVTKRLTRIRKQKPVRTLGCHWSRLVR